MMTAIIVDDEAHCVNRIRNLVADYCPNEITILESCSDIDSAYEAIVRLSPRFIFLDVQIHEATGFDLLRRFETVGFEVVFATAYEKYAIEAFKFSAADYLLKPIDPDDFIAMMEKLKHRIAGNEAIKNLEIVVDNFHNLKHGKLTIPTLEGKEVFDISSIIHCEAVGNYTMFNFRNRKSLKDSRTLKRYEEILTRHGFFRIHNSHLINLDDVKRFENGKNSFVVLKNNEKLPISTRRKEDFLKRLAEISQ